MLKFKPMKDSDYERVTEIYNYYILHTTVTNDTETKTVEQMKRQIPLNTEGYHPFTIWFDSKLAGYIYLAPYSSRKAFSQTATVSIYLDKNFEGHHIGTKALRFIIEEGKKAGLHSLVAHINAKNLQSMAIFGHTEFTRVGLLEEAGYKFGEYQDTGIYQRML